MQTPVVTGHRLGGGSLPRVVASSVSDPVGTPGTASPVIHHDLRSEASRTGLGLMASHKLLLDPDLNERRDSLRK